MTFLPFGGKRARWFYLELNYVSSTFLHGFAIGVCRRERSKLLENAGLGRQLGIMSDAGSLSRLRRYARKLAE
jgi:hypothetical protein